MAFRILKASPKVLADGSASRPPSLHTFKSAFTLEDSFIPEGSRMASIDEKVKQIVTEQLGVDQEK